MQCLSQYEIACVERHQSKAHCDPSPNEALDEVYTPSTGPYRCISKYTKPQYIHKYISYQYIFRQFFISLKIYYTIINAFFKSIKNRCSHPCISIQEITLTGRI